MSRAGPGPEVVGGRDRLVAASGALANHACRAGGIAALSSSMKGKKGTIARSGEHGYDVVLSDVVRLVEAARNAEARSVKAVMTATYWAIGRNIARAMTRVTLDPT